MTAEEFYLDEHKGVFYGDPVIERAIFRFAEAYAKHENELLRGYVQHKEDCKVISKYSTHLGSDCNCGLNQALKK